MKLNNVVKSILKTAVYLMDQTADTVDRASSRASEMAEDARDAIYPREDHTVRNLLAFAAGVGVGIGAGMLLAPPVERNFAITSPTKCRRLLTGSAAALMNIPPAPRAARRLVALHRANSQERYEHRSLRGVSMRLGKQLAGMALAMALASVAYARSAGQPQARYEGRRSLHQKRRQRYWPSHQQRGEKNRPQDKDHQQKGCPQKRALKRVMAQPRSNKRLNLSDVHDCAALRRGCRLLGAVASGGAQLDYQLARGKCFTRRWDMRQRDAAAHGRLQPCRQKSDATRELNRFNC